MQQVYTTGCLARNEQLRPCEAHVDVHKRDMRADMPVILHACLCLSHARLLLICWRS